MNLQINVSILFLYTRAAQIITVSRLTPSALRPGWASCLFWIIVQQSSIQSRRFFNGPLDDTVDVLLTKFQSHEGIFEGIMNLQT